MLLNLPLGCDVGPKRLFLAPGDTPDFEHAFSNYAYFHSCGRIWLSSVQRAQKVAGLKHLFQCLVVLLCVLSIAVFCGNVWMLGPLRCLVHGGGVVDRCATVLPGPGQL